MPQNSESCSENGLFTPRALFSKLGWFPGFWKFASRRKIQISNEVSLKRGQTCTFQTCTLFSARFLALTTSCLPSMPSSPPSSLYCFHTKWMKVGNHEPQEGSGNAEMSPRTKCTFERCTFVTPWSLCGDFWRSISKIASEIRVFKRDHFLQDSGCNPVDLVGLVAPYCAIPRDYLSDTHLLRAMGFLASQHGQLGAIPPPPFLSVSPLESMRSGGAIPPPPPQKGYLSDTCAIPYENKANGWDTPLCDTISKGVARYGGVSRTGPLSS